MKPTHSILFFIARALLSIIFLISGVKKIFYWDATQSHFIMTFCEWHMRLQGAQFIEWLIRYAPFFLGFATFLEIVGGLLILSGYFFRLGAFLLLIFLIPTTVVFHAFWFQIGDKYNLEVAMFLKNLAIMGGLLLLSLGHSFKRQPIL